MLRALVPVLLGVSLAAALSAHAKPKFIASDIAGKNSGMLICDLDGDGLKDIVLIDDFNLSLFYQNQKTGFTRDPQQLYHLATNPCIVWAIQSGRPAESLLVMTSDGVSELRFTNRTNPPALRPIIRQPTIIPDTAAVHVEQLVLSAATGRGWPLVLVPAADGLEVWANSNSDRDEWRRVQVISDAIDVRLTPSLWSPGYSRSFGFNLSIGDMNRDGREDLMIRRSQAGRTNSYRLYLQLTNGVFTAEPTMTYAGKIEENAWLCWADLNHDGQVDLIKGLWLEEPSFIPGNPSAKVVVSTYVADERGRIPAEPQQLFRKKDWTPTVPVVDVDGDGFLDLALGYSILDGREGLRKEITAKQMDFSLRFHFYRPGTGFSREADFQRDVIIHLDRSELMLSWGRSDYFDRYARLGGDFNGDGKTDLLVREHSDDISAYFFVSRQKGFSPEPDLRFNCPEMIDWWQDKDLNNDGISDLIVTLANQNVFRIFISQK